MAFLDRLIAGLEAFRGSAPGGTPATGEPLAPALDSEAPSVDLVLDEMHRTMTAQQEHLKTIDIKASFYLTSASIIVGFAGLRSSDSPWLGQGWLAVALGIYLLLLIAVIQAYRMRLITSTGLSPTGLQEYLIELPTFTKRRFIASFRYIHEANVAPIGRKAWWLRRGEWLFGVMVGYLVIVLIGHSQSGHIRPQWVAFRGHLWDVLHWIA